MQYCSLQHWTLLLSPVTSTAGYCFCFVSIFHSFWCYFSTDLCCPWPRASGSSSRPLPLTSDVEYLLSALLVRHHSPHYGINSYWTIFTYYWLYTYQNSYTYFYIFISLNVIICLILFILNQNILIDDIYSSILFNFVCSITCTHQ